MACLSNSVKRGGAISIFPEQASEARESYPNNHISAKRLQKSGRDDDLGKADGDSYQVKLAGRWASGPCWGLDVQNDLLYLFDGSQLEVLDCSIPSSPNVIGRAWLRTTPQSSTGICASGDHVYIADEIAGLIIIIDASDPTKPAEIGVHDTADSAMAVEISGSYAYVADWGDGLRIIDVSDPTNPVEIGFYDTGGYARDVALSGSYAYVADWGDGLRIIDVSDPTNPVEIGFYDTGGYARDVALSGSCAYVADWGDGLRIIDVSDPTNPVEIGFYDTAGYAQNVILSGNHAYVADVEDGLRIIDVSDPTNPIEVGLYDTGGYPFLLASYGNHMYAAYRYGHPNIRIFDLSHPIAPITLGFYDTGDAAFDVITSSSHAYISDIGTGLRVIDVSNSMNPIEVGALYDGPYYYQYARALALSNDYLYMVGEAGFRVVDVSDPTNPVKIGFYDTAGRAEGVAVSGSYAYVADGMAGLRVIDVSDPANLVEVGFYNTGGAMPWM
jgi:hypothetical protein